jgi:hypothetical protein
MGVHVRLWNGLRTLQIQLLMDWRAEIHIGKLCPMFGQNKLPYLLGVGHTPGLQYIIYSSLD